MYNIKPAVVIKTQLIKLGKIICEYDQTLRFLPNWPTLQALYNLSQLLTVISAETFRTAPERVLAGCMYLLTISQQYKATEAKLHTTEPNQN